ncbi:MAG: leucine-rich repeat protein [Lachnospiraceae bacterium]|nr:leucine-rich repeat protein [Lachnospiraceae bacterium]
MKRNLKRRLLAGVLSACMIFQTVGMAPVYAAGNVRDGGVSIDTGIVCENHTEHTADCYVQIENCIHDHTDACYSDADDEEATGSDAKNLTECEHICDEASGCITKKLNCTHSCELCAENGGADAGEDLEEAIEEDIELATESNADKMQSAIEELISKIDALPEADEITDENRKTAKADLEEVFAEYDKLFEDETITDLDGQLGTERMEKLTALREVLLDMVNLVEEEVYAVYDGKDFWKATKEDPTVSTGDYIGTGDQSSIVYLYAEATSSSMMMLEESLKEVTFADTVTGIADYAFYGCSNLEKVYMPSKASISRWAFYGCSKLSDIDLSNVTEVSPNAFDNCTSLTRVSLSSASKIDTQAFQGCTQIQEADITNATKIGNSAFQNCTALKKVTMPNVIEIGTMAFRNCSALQSADLQNATTIGEAAFEKCRNLASVVMPKVTQIGTGAFQYCDKLTNITMSAELPTVGRYIFQGANSPRALTLYGNPRLYDAVIAQFDDADGTKDNMWYGCELPASFINTNAVDSTGTLKVKEGSLTPGLGEDNTITFTAAFEKANAMRMALVTNQIVLMDGETQLGEPVIAKQADDGRWTAELTVNTSEWAVGEHDITARFAGNNELNDSETNSVAVTVIESYAVYENGKFFAATKEEPEVATDTEILEENKKTINYLYSNVETVPNNLMAGCGGLKTVTMPNATTIAYRAFYDCTSLTGVELPKATEIGENAFDGCNALTSVEIPKVITIKRQAFMQCALLETVTMPNVTIIEDNAFSNCPVLETVEMPNVIEIGAYAFSACERLANVSAPKVTTISDGAFMQCGLANITLGATPPTVDTNAFLSCPASRNLTIFGNDAFRDDVINAYKAVDDGVTDELWYGWTLPESLVGTGVSASAGTLTVTDGKTDTMFGENNEIIFTATFAKAPASATEGLLRTLAINEVQFKDGNEPLEAAVAATEDGNGNWVAKLTVNTSAWAVDTHNITAEFTGNHDLNGAVTTQVAVTVSETYAVYNGTGFYYADSEEHTKPTEKVVTDKNIIQNLYIDVEAVPDVLMWNCANLKIVTCSDKVTQIDDGAFSACSVLTKAEMTAVTKIGNDAFSSCAALATVDLSEVTSIGDRAFMYCSVLTKAEMPEVTQIDNNAFDSCTALTTVTMPKVSAIGESAFSNCTALTTITMPKVTKIGTGAFYNCVKLNSITLGATPPTVGEDAFRGCSNTRNLTILGNTAFAADVLNAYKAVDDGVTDELWYGWTLPTAIDGTNVPNATGTLAATAGNTTATYSQANTITFTASFQKAGESRLRTAVQNQITLMNGSSVVESKAATLTEGVYSAEFTVDTSELDAGTYHYTATFDGNGSLKESESNVVIVTVTQSATDFEDGVKADRSEYTYGDTITITAKPQATGTAVNARFFTAPGANQMALFVGGKQISEAVTADADGVYTMTYDTKGKHLTIGPNSITANYVGNTNMADVSDDVLVMLNRKPIMSAEVDTTDAAASKEYDGTDSFTGVALTLDTSSIFSGDTVTAVAAGTSAGTDVGTSHSFTATSVTLDGTDAIYYSLESTAVSGTVAITEATPAVTVTAVKQKSLLRSIIGDHDDIIVLTATVTGVPGGTTPAGTVTFKNGETTIESNAAMSKGVASCEWKNPAADVNYTITAEFTAAENTNYKNATGTSEAFDISKAEQKALNITVPAAVTYGDADFTLGTTGGSGTGAVTYEVTEGTVVSVTKDGKVAVLAAGEATITATKAGDPNYNAKTGTVNITVKAAAPVLTWGEAAQTVTYTGKPAVIKAPTAAGVTGGTIPNGTISYTYEKKSLSSLFTAPENGLPVDAGIYTVTAHIAAEGNYTAADSSTMELTIIKSTPELSIGADYLGKPYDGKAIDPPTAAQMTITGTAYAEVTFAYSQNADMSSPLTTAPADAGTYYVQAGVKEGANTNAAVSAPKEFTIDRINPVIEVATDKTSQLGGKDVQVTVKITNPDGAATGFPEAGEIAIAPTNAALKSGTAITGANGTYTATYTLAAYSSGAKAHFTATVPKATTNYNADTTGTSSGDVTILDQYVPTVTIEADETSVIYGESVTLTAAVGKDGKTSDLAGTVQFKEGGTAIGEPVAIDSAGAAAITVDKATLTYNNGTEHSFTAEFTPAAGSDYKSNASSACEVKVTKAAMTGEAAITGIAKYGQTLTADTSTLKGIDGEELGTFTYQWKRAGSDIAGETKSTYVVAEADLGKAVTVEVTPVNGNYSAKTSGAVTPAKADSTIAFTDTSLDKTYDGSPITDPVKTTNYTTTGSTGNVTFEWYSGATKLASAPENVGTYTVKAILKADNKYEGASTGTNKEFKITAKTIEPDIEAIDEQTYTGKQLTPEVTVKIKDSTTTLVSGSDYTVAYGDNVNAGTNAGNVTVTLIGNYSGEKEAKFTIKKAPLTITGGTVTGRAWDGTRTAVVTAITFDGLKNDETLTMTADYTVTGAQFANANVGTGKEVSGTVTLVSDGATAKNYSLAQGALVNVKGDITRASSPAAPTDGSVDDTNNTFGFTVNPNFTDITAYEYSLDSGKNWTKVTVKPIPLGNVNIPAGQLQVRIAATDNHAAGEVLSNDKAFTAVLEGDVAIAGTAVYGGTLNATVSGAQAGADLHYKWMAGDKKVGTDSTAYAIGKEAVGQTVKVVVTAFADYTGALTSASTAKVAQKEIAPIAHAEDKEYDGNTTAEVSFTFAEGEILNKDEVAVIATGTFADKKMGTGKTVALSGVALTGADKDYYTMAAAPANPTAAITAKVLTVTDGTLVITKTYDGTGKFAAENATGSLALTNPVQAAGEDIKAVITGYGSAADGNVGKDKAITLTIGLSGVDKENYKLDSTSYPFNAGITAKEITPIIEAIADQTYSGSQLKPEVTVKDGTTTLVLGTDYTVTYGENINAGENAGSVTVTLKGNYTGSGEVNFTITSIDQAPLVITQVSEKTYGDKAFTLETTGGDGTGAVTYSVPEDSKVLAIDGDQAAIIGSGTVTVTAVKAGDGNYNAATATLEITVAKKAATVTAEDVSMTAGEAKPAYSYKADGFVNGETITGVTFDDSAVNITTAGVYKVMPQGGTVTGNGADNYELTYLPGSVTVQVKTDALDAAVTAASEAKKDIIVSDKEASSISRGTKFVTTGEMALLDAAIQKAEEVKASAISSEVINQAIAELNDAVTAFKAAIKTGTKSSSGGGSGSGGGSSSSGGSSLGTGTSVSAGSSGTVSTDEKKGQINSATGIITGATITGAAGTGAASGSAGDGYSHWVQEKKGWKLQYADSTYAAGTMVTAASGAATEQLAWEQINGAWYAFGADGYTKSGMLFDTALNGWFYIDINSGMKTGWQFVDGTWRYFNPLSDGTKGKMAANTKTPDGYNVGQDGIWDGREADKS